MCFCECSFWENSKGFPPTFEGKFQNFPQKTHHITCKVGKIIEGRDNCLSNSNWAMKQGAPGCLRYFSGMTFPTQLCGDYFRNHMTYGSHQTTRIQWNVVSFFCVCASIEACLGILFGEDFEFQPKKFFQKKIWGENQIKKMQGVTLLQTMEYYTELYDMYEFYL